MLVWTIERAYARRWGHVGLLIAVGTAVKLVPALLLPLLFFVAPRDRRRVLVGSFAAGVALAVLPFINVLPSMYHSVIGYHTERGVQAESIWGAGMLAAQRLADYPVAIVASHRAWDAVAPASDLLKTISNVASLVVVLGAIALAVRTRVGDLRRATLLTFGAMSLLVGVGRVYSPQYVLWLIALGAVAVAVVPRLAAPAVGVLAVTTLLAHLEFPVWFWDALFYDKGAALIVLLVRDVLTLVIGALALWAWKRAAKEPIVLDGLTYSLRHCHPPWSVSGGMDLSESVLRIDCDDCVMAGTDACSDCIVTYLCTRDDGGAVVIDVQEVRALRLLQQGGLAPALRHRRAEGE